MKFNTQPKKNIMNNETRQCMCVFFWQLPSYQPIATINKWILEFAKKKQKTEKTAPYRIQTRNMKLTATKGTKTNFLVQRLTWNVKISGEIISTKKAHTKQESSGHLSKSKETISVKTKDFAVVNLGEMLKKRCTFFFPIFFSLFIVFEYFCFKRETYSQKKFTSNGSTNSFVCAAAISLQWNENYFSALCFFGNVRCC